MAKYLYDKYSVKSSYSITTVLNGEYSYGETYAIEGYSGYSFNTSTGIFTLTGTMMPLDAGQSGTLYTLNGNTLFSESWINMTTTRLMESSATLNYAKDVFIETISAEDGTYPIDGVSGLYWYVKKGLAFPSLQIKIDGVLKASTDGWVKIDGALRQIEGIWTNINGVLKKI